LGTIIALGNYNKYEKLHVFSQTSLLIMLLIILNSLQHYFFLIIKNSLLQFLNGMSAQFDGEEQKAGAFASVFFRFNWIPQIS